MSFEDRNGHLHAGDGKYKEKPASAPGASALLTHGGEADPDDDLGYGPRPEPTWEDLNDAQWKGQPLLMRIQPQQWVNDNAMDDGPSEEFDIAPLLRTKTYAEREAIFDGIRRGHYDVLETLYENAAARGLVTAGHGPYYVYPDVHTFADHDERGGDDLDAWDAANPYDAEAIEAERREHHRPKTAYAAATDRNVTELRDGDLVVFEEPLAAENDPKCAEYLVVGEPEIVQTMQYSQQVRLRVRRTVAPAGGVGTEIVEDFPLHSNLKIARLCDTHSGAWGNNPGCAACTQPDNTPQPLPGD